MHVAVSSGDEIKNDVQINWFQIPVERRRLIYDNLCRPAVPGKEPTEIFLDTEDLEIMEEKRVISSKSLVDHYMDHFNIDKLKLSSPVEKDVTQPEIRGHRISDNQWIRPGIECNKRDLYDYLLSEHEPVR